MRRQPHSLSARPNSQVSQRWPVDWVVTLLGRRFAAGTTAFRGLYLFSNVVVLITIEALSHMNEVNLFSEGYLFSIIICEFILIKSIY